MGKKEVKLKTVMNREQLACYLEDLANRVRQGSIPIETMEDKMLLRTAENAGVKIEATEKKDRYKLELKLSWLQVVL